MPTFTPSQLLRFALLRDYDQKSAEIRNAIKFEDWYAQEMNKIIREVDKRNEPPIE